MSKHSVLDNKTHLDLRVDTGSGPDLGDAVMACLTVPDEFRQVQAAFPILFRRDNVDGRFSALALFGFENGENLFLENGKWDAAYRPLALSVQPFLVGRNADGSAGGQVHIDMDHPRISRSGKGVRVFDESGQATPYLEDIAEKLGLLDQGYRASEAFYASLRRHDLLEPFKLEVPLEDGSKHSLVGFHIIDEDRLRGLGGDALADLHRDGHLMPIFMAMASLSRLGDLVGRRNRRNRHG